MGRNHVRKALRFLVSYRRTWGSFYGGYVRLWRRDLASVSQLWGTRLAYTTFVWSQNDLLFRKYLQFCNKINTAAERKLIDIVKFHNPVFYMLCRVRELQDKLINYLSQTRYILVSNWTTCCVQCDWKLKLSIVQKGLVLVH